MYRLSPEPLPKPAHTRPIFVRNLGHPAWKSAKICLSSGRPFTPSRPNFVWIGGWPRPLSPRVLWYLVQGITRLQLPNGTCDKYLQFQSVSTCTKGTCIHGKPLMIITDRQEYRYLYLWQILVNTCYMEYEIMSLICFLDVAYLGKMICWGE